MAVTEEVDQCMFPVVEGDNDDAAANKVSSDCRDKRTESSTGFIHSEVTGSIFESSVLYIVKV